MARAHRRIVASLLGLLLGSAVATAALPEAADARSSGKRVKLTAEQRAFLGAVTAAARTSQRRWGVPASVTIAQAVLETGWGTSDLVRSAHNYFGMTCGPNGGGPVATGCVVGPDRICDRAGCWPSTASFRVYRSMADSVADHGRTLSSNPRYRSAYRARSRPATFVKRMARAGYATDPAYAQRVIAIINKYKLNRHNKR